MLVAAGGWAYATSFQGAFVFDDFVSIADNPNVRTLWPPTRAMSAPPDTTLSGRPIGSLTLALNYALAPPDARDVFEPEPADAIDRTAARFERNVWGYHAVNLAIHLAAALALFGVVRRTLLGERLRARLGSAANALSFAVALLWVVHPLNTEAVTYVVQRVESLMGLFALLALYCAIRAAGATRSYLWVAGALAAYALALGSKEVAVVVPILILSWDFVFLSAAPTADARAQAGWRQRWPLYAGLAVISAGLAFTVPGARARSVGFHLQGWTPWTYLLTESGVVVHYLRLAIWPAPLVLDPYWSMVRSLGPVAWPLAMLAGLVGLTLVGMTKRRPAAFAMAWFFAILAPTSSVLPVVTEVAAEHRMYLPLAALVSLAVVGGYLGARVLLARVSPTSLLPRLAPALGTAVVLGVAILLGLQTRARSLDYVTDEHIWRDTIAKQPGNPRARTGLGADLVAAGRYEEAEGELQASLAIDPARPETLSNLGAAEFALGKIDSSIVHLERAVALRPEYAAAHLTLAEAYLARRHDGLAATHFRRVLEAKPDHADVLKKLALLLAVSSDDAVRDGAAALPLAQRAVGLTSRRDAASLMTLAAALAELGRFDDAAGVVREAMALSPAPALAAELSRLLDAYSARRTIRRPSR